LKPEHIAALHEIVLKHAQASLDEIADELYRRCGAGLVNFSTERDEVRAGGVRTDGMLASNCDGRDTPEPHPSSVVFVKIV
jgi:hypothetical protein